MQRNAVDCGLANFRGVFYTQLHSLSTAESPGGMHAKLLAGVAIFLYLPRSEHLFIQNS